MKLTVHYSKKAGLPEFGSECIGVTLEIPLQEGSPEEVAAVFEAAQGDLKRLVEAKLAGAGRTNGNGGVNGHHASRSNGGHEAKGNGKTNGNGNGASGQPEPRGPRNAGSAIDQMVSPKQVKFLRGLSARAGLRPRDLDVRAQQMFNDPNITVRDLTKRQASDLIDALQEEVAA